jgi:hypothetical protein
MTRRHRIVATLLVLAAAGLVFTTNAEHTSAQTPKSTPKAQVQPPPETEVEAPVQPRRIISRGDDCTRKGDPRPGVTRRDACGRWYCGKATERDIIELRPDHAEKFRCTWRLEGDRCLCRRTAAKAKVDDNKTAPKGKKKAGKAK